MRGNLLIQKEKEVFSIFKFGIGDKSRNKRAAAPADRSAEVFLRSGIALAGARTPAGNDIQLAMPGAW